MSIPIILIVSGISCSFISALQENKEGVIGGLIPALVSAIYIMFTQGGN